MQKSQNALFLIGFKNKKPGSAENKRSNQKNSEKLLFIYAGDNNHAEPDKKKNKSGAEIRLEKNENRGNQHVNSRYDYVAHIGDFYVPSGKIFSQHKNDNQL
jgi:hypothetical protein